MGLKLAKFKWVRLYICVAAVISAVLFLLIVQPRTEAASSPKSSEHYVKGTAYGFDLNLGAELIHHSVVVTNGTEQRLVYIRSSPGSDLPNELCSIDPVKQTERCEPMSNRYPDDGMYGPNQMYGVWNKQEVVYTRVSDKKTKTDFNYDVVRWNPFTGKRTVVTTQPVEFEYGNVFEPWYNNSWIPTAGTLTVHHYSGAIQTIDVKMGKVVNWKGKYRPVLDNLFVSYLSPDDSRVWLDDDLDYPVGIYDQTGKRYSQKDHHEELLNPDVWTTSYPGATWSDDSKYVYLSYAKDEKHRIDMVETYDVIPQLIDLLDRNGQRIARFKADNFRSGSIEVLGWTAHDQYLVLKKYQLRGEQKTDVRYELFDPKTRSLSPLSVAKDWRTISKPLLVGDVSGLLDVKTRQLYPFEHSFDLTMDNSAVRISISNKKLTMETLDWQNKTMEKKTQTVNIENFNPIMITHEWLIDETGKIIDLKKLFGGSKG